ncbi:MAG: peptide chain release factor 1 [Kiritimatiellae bacterium]|nr:peptide chain release factor 1 [Kiritimatiellia bacterium]
MIPVAQIERLRRRLDEVETEMSTPGLAAQPQTLRARMAEHARLKSAVSCADEYFRLEREQAASEELLRTESDPDMRAMAQADAAAIAERLPAARDALLAALIPPDPADDRGVIMEIRAGTGGEEAALFAAVLFRMYTRYAAERGWRTETIEISASEIGGYKEAVFNVAGEGVYRRLRHESGVHRVQRVPATEQQGRIHTSAATVAVLPEAEESDDLVIRPEDLEIDTFRSGGAGGQHVNKTESAVRIRHIPSGVVVKCQEERSQIRNREKAMRFLRARLLEAQREREAAATAGDRRAQVGSGDRSERIRTYNYPQNRVTDHRIDLTVYQLDRIVEGHMDAVIQPLVDHELRRKVEALTREPTR